MGNALQAVLQLKAQEQQAEQFRSQQITQAAELLQRGIQANQANQLDRLRMGQQQKQFDISSQFNRDQLSQTGKYQDSQIKNQELDNVRLLQQLELQKRQYAQEQLKILSGNRQNKENNAIDLAVKGLTKNPDGSIAFDEKLRDPLEVRKQAAFEDYLKTLSGQVKDATVKSDGEVAPDKEPTLNDAFPMPEQNFVQIPYISANGKLAVKNNLDPQYQQNIQLRTAQVKEFEDFAGPLEKLAGRLDDLDSAIDKTPEFKEGFGSKLVAKGTNALADFNNEEWFKNYDLAFNKTFLPAAQAEGMSKVMSDLDLKTQIQSLGDPTAPRSIKKKALQQIRESLGKYADSKIGAFGADRKIISKIYPESDKAFGFSKTKESSSLPPDRKARLEELRKKKAEGTLGK